MESFHHERLALLRRESDREIRRLNQALEVRAGELEAALRELEFFTYTVAHDLRSPLRALGGFSDLIRAEYGERLDDTGQDYLNRISEAARRMDGLVADLLAYSRAAREQIILEDVDLVCAVDEAVTQATTGRDGIWSIDSEGASGVVRAHRPMLIQVVVNLLSNALKFVPPGTLPQVRIRSEGRADSIRLWVEDNGIGIHPDHHARIFGVFQRLHRSEAYGGTGIGLAIVKRGIERMGGAVGLDSAPGQGSRFWIELPRTETN